MATANNPVNGRVNSLMDAIRITVVMALTAACTHASANAGHDVLMAMTDKSRNDYLTGVLSQMPGPCVVERNFFRGFDQKRAMWAAGCANKMAYAIMILDDAKGSTRILDCQLILERAKTDCFAKLGH